MHIQYIHLWRFKQFKNTKIDLRDGLSLVVGGNNSGKSSVLQAIATWQFCKTILEIEKGRKAWAQNSGVQGVGLGIVDFTPLNVPSLAHLWTSLKSQKEKEPDGYTLKIRVGWESAGGVGKFLEIGMSLANDRLFVKTTATNLTLAEIQDKDGNPIEGRVPNVAYMPPFAGITDRESRLTPAMRTRLIGQGLSGGVIRNAVFDLHESNRQERIRLGAGQSKIKSSDLKRLRESDPWELLQKALQETFGTELKVTPFNERYHSYLKVECVKGEILDGKFKRFPKFSSRDLMVEGSGFLQWLSVYALALSPNIDVVLLDEPDAHLHPMLQQQLVSRLSKIADDKKKQILLATHSTELIRGYEFEKILALKKGKAGRYLGEDSAKIGVLAGIGAAHTPSLHALIQHKKMLIVEGVSDERFLKILCERAGEEWPKNLVSWFWTGNHSERWQLYRQLKSEIPELVAISVRDRDDESDNTVDSDLVDRGFKVQDGYVAMKWRRRHIENYLFSVSAIARCAEITEQAVNDLFAEHAIVLPADATASDVAIVIRDARGKAIMKEGEDSVEKRFHCSRDDIAKQMESHEIAADIKTFFAKLKAMCAPPPAIEGEPMGTPHEGL
jgi:energy-coupling factor transporter ATP-binding protein EcfA2